MNDTKKIALVSACALLFAFGGLFLYVKVYESTLISGFTLDTASIIPPSSIKKIFLIGGSNTMTLNSNHIESLLSDKGFHQYRVYNLAHILDSPTQRMDDSDSVISAEPTMVLYGIGFRNLGYQEFDNRHPCSNQEEIMVDYLSDLQRELRRDENTLTFLPDDNEILPTVKDVINYFEQIFPNQPDIFSSFANPKQVTVNVLRMVFQESNITDNDKISIPGNIDNKLWHWGTILTYNEIKSFESLEKTWGKGGPAGKFHVCPEDLNRELTNLRELISKFQENNIEVLIFFTPYTNIYLNYIGESEVANLLQFLEKLSIEENVKFDSLHDDYLELEVWHDYSHVARNPDSLIYSNDVAEFILQNLDPYTNLRTVDTTNDDLRFMDLSYSDLRGVDLSYKDLTGADLQNSNLLGANLVGAILKETNLSYAYLRSADLSGQDLSDAFLVGVNLEGANLKDVLLSGIDLTGADLSNVDLSYKDLKGTTLTGAKLDHANLIGVDLSGKDLSRASMRFVDLSGINMTGTILTGADLSSSQLTGVDLSGKDLSGTSLRVAELKGQDFTGSILIGTLFGASQLQFVDFSGLNLTNAEFTFSVLYGAKFSDADLSGVDFAAAQLAGADFSGANLQNARFTFGNLTNLEMLSANLAYTNFSSCLNHPLCM